jgi:hypothetical protein
MTHLYKKVDMGICEASDVLHLHIKNHSTRNFQNHKDHTSCVSLCDEYIFNHLKIFPKQICDPQRAEISRNRFGQLSATCSSPKSPH